MRHLIAVLLVIAAAVGCSDAEGSSAAPPSSQPTATQAPADELGKACSEAPELWADAGEPFPGDPGWPGYTDSVTRWYLDLPAAPQRKLKTWYLAVTGIEAPAMTTTGLQQSVDDMTTAGDQLMDACLG